MDYADLIEYLNGHADAAQQKAVEAWIKVDTANEAEYLKVKRIWESQTGAPPDPQVDIAWERVKAQIQPVRKRRWIYGIAAAVTLLIMLVGGSYFFSAAPPLLVATTTLGDSTTLITLSDGSRVWLDQASTLRYPKSYTDKRREVELLGRAYFEVAKAAAPFIITAGDTQIEVLGTSFDVMARPDSNYSEVLVNSGRVAFYSAVDENNKVILNKGEAARFSKSNKELVKKEYYDPNKLAWYTKVLRFENSPLREAFLLLEKTYGINLQVEKEAILNCKLTATLPADNSENALNVIVTLFDLQLEEKEEQQFLLKGMGCK